MNHKQANVNQYRERLGSQGRPYRLPNRKQHLLTVAFLADFKLELAAIFELQDTATYWSHYVHLLGTGGFWLAFERTCEASQCSQALYEYANRLPWVDSDAFESQVLERMLAFGLMETGTPSEAIFGPTDADLAEMEAAGEIRWVETLHRFKGYSVIRREWELMD